MIGWKIIATVEDNNYNCFKGQTDKDWSAIYIQFEKEHALRYLGTKYEYFSKVALGKFVFDKKVNFLELSDDFIFNEKITSLEKAHRIKEIIKKKNLYQINSENPLMFELGKFDCCIITYDTENNKEIVVPHKLLEDDELIKYEIEYKFFRNESNILKTDKVINRNGEEISLTKDEKNYTEELIKKI
eukprot:gene10747-3367_t